MKKYIKNSRQITERINNVQIFLALFAIIILQIPIAFGQIKSWYDHSINEYNFKAKKIESLEAGVNLEFFKKNLGDPVVSHEIKIGETELKENYFVDRLYYVQSLSTLSETVVYFAVTTRDLNFNPKFLSPDQSMTIVLGRSKLNSYGATDFLTIPTKYFEGLNKEGNFDYKMGAHDFNYYERYYLANPGNYQTIYLGLNQAGYMDWDNGYLPDKPSWDLTSDDLIKFRKSHVINTYAETAPLIGLGVDDKDPVVASGGIGVDYNTVRVFNF